MKFPAFLTLLLSLALVAVAPLRADDPAPPKDFRTIFNGKDLTGWYGLNPHSVVKLEGEKREANLQQQRAEFPQHWSVENGDIELLIEYKTVPHADSGVYLRGSPQVQIWDVNQVFDPAKPDRKPHQG